MLPSAGWAHPGAFRTAAHLTRVELHPDQIVVDYYVEVALNPKHRHTATQDLGALDVEPWSILANGMVVTVDGEQIILEPDPEAPPVLRRTAAAHGTGLTLTAPLPQEGDPLTISIANTNYPDLPGFFATTIQVDSALTVVGSSLLELTHGQVVSDRDGSWSAREEGRDAEVTVSRSGGWLGRLTAAARRQASTLQPLAQAVRPSPLRGWLSGAVWPGMWLASLVALTGLVLVGPPPDPSTAPRRAPLDLWLTGPLLTAVALGGPLAGQASLIALLLGVATLIVALSPTPRALLATAPPLAGCAVVACLGDDPLALTTATLTAAGVWATRGLRAGRSSGQSTPGAGPTHIVPFLVGTVVAARGLAALWGWPPT